MSNMSNDEIKALAEIFALCYKATNSRNDADLGSAMVFPFRYATQYVRKLHMLGKATPELEDSQGLRQSPLCAGRYVQRCPNLTTRRLDAGVLPRQI